MSNDENEFDQADDGFDTDLGFDEGQENGTNRNNALLKIALVAGGLVVVLVGIFMFGGSGNKQGPKSEVSSAPVDQAALPAQKEPTPEYREALVNYNQQMIDQAKESGQSVVPIPIDPARQQLNSRVEESQEDPAERFRRIQEEYRRQQETQNQARRGQQAQEEAGAHQQAVSALAQSMSNYLNSANSSRVPRGMSDIAVSYTLSTDALAAGHGTGTGLDGTNLVTATAKTIIPATTVEYGQLLIEANTDAPGPVMAMVVTGKLAGSRLLGSFQKTDEYLTINFSQLVTKEGKTIPVQAIVLDPDTTLPGVITEIDRKYFERYILPAAANFISGVGEALAETQTTTNQTSTSTVTNSDEPDFSDALSQGISDSFDGIADALEDSGKREQPMLRVAAGTPIGILFTQPVLDPDSVAEVQAQQQAAAQKAQAQNPYANLLPGTAIPGYPGVAGAQAGYVSGYAPAGTVPVYYGMAPTTTTSGGVAASVPTAATATSTTPTAGQ